MYYTVCELWLTCLQIVYCFNVHYILLEKTVIKWLKKNRNYATVHLMVVTYCQMSFVTYCLMSIVSSSSLVEMEINMSDELKDV